MVPPNFRNPGIFRYPAPGFFPDVRLLMPGWMTCIEGTGSELSACTPNYYRYAYGGGAMNKDLLIKRNMREAEKELAKGHIDTALQYCDAVIRLDQNHQEASLLRLKCLITTRNPREILTEADSIVGKFPDVPEAWMDSAFIYYQNREYERAIASYHRCISLDPGNYRAVHNLGGSLIAIGKEEEGLSRMEEAIRMEPGYLTGYSRLMEIYHEKGRYSDCIRCGESAGDLMKSSPEIRGYYGDALYQTGKYARSRVVLSSLLADMRKRSRLFTLFCPVVTDADNYNHQGRDRDSDPDYAAATYYLAFLGHFIFSEGKPPRYQPPCYCGYLR